MLPRVTVECGVVFEPEIRFSAAGRAWAKVRVAANDQVRGDNGQWQDGPAFYFDVVCFGRMAENLVESVRKGDRMVAHGKFEEQEWESGDGERRRGMRLVADEVGVSLRFNPAKTPRALEEGGVSVPREAATQPAEDPWATPLGSGEPPF